MNADQPSPNAETKKLLATIGWPGLVVVLLMGHVTVMMIALTLGRTIPAALETVEPFATEGAAAARLVEEGDLSP